MEKKTTNLKDKPLFHATIEEVMLVALEMGVVVPNVANESKPHLILGIKAIAQELNISVSSVNRLISQGTLDSAIYQSGKLVWFDLREVLSILKKTKSK